MTPGIDSTESIPSEKWIPLWNLFLEASISCEGIADFIIVIVTCCVYVVEGHPCWSTTHFQQANNTYGSCRQRMKSLFLLWKVNILYFSPHNQSKNTGSVPRPPPFPPCKPPLPPHLNPPKSPLSLSERSHNEDKQRLRIVAVLLSYI